MKKELFTNVGGSIKTICKTVANLIFGFYVLVGAIIFILACVWMSAGGGYGGLILLASIITIGFGYAVSRLVVMILYAYGEITERLVSIDSALAKDSSKQRTTKKGETTVKVEQVKQNKQRNTPWKCEFCGHQNGEGVAWCESCGVEYVEVEK